MDNTDNSHDDDEDDDDDTDDQSQRSLLVLGASPTQLESFQEDVQYLWAPFVDNSTSTTTTIPIYETPPSSLNFLRNHVAVSRPCIIRNSILVPNVDATVDTDTDVVPLQLTLDDLVQRFPDNQNGNGDGNNDAITASPSPLPLLTVDVTPDGHGDCLRKVAVPVPVPVPDDDDDDENDILGRKKEVIQKVFVKPLEQEMSLSTFRHYLRQGRHKQQQQKLHEGGRGGRRRNKDTISSRVFVEEEALITTDKKKNEDTVDVEGDGTDTDTDFLDDCVLYYSRQNDCLREELLPLWNAKVNSSSSPLNDNKKNDTDHQYLFPRSFPWAEGAFFGQLPTPPHQNMDTTTTTTTATNHGRGPDACNIWIGDERVVSSMHKDYYENLFYVASGEKVFHLCPPSDIPFLYEQEVISGRFQHHHPPPHQVDSDDDDDDDDDGRPKPRRTRRWTVALDREEEEDPGEDIVGTPTTTSSNEHEHEVSKSNEKKEKKKKKKYSKVHWIAADPFACRNDDDVDNHDHDDNKGEEDHQQERTTEVNESSSLLYPLSHYAHPMTVTVQAGELLYLPSLWFHRVTQTCETIGINYWYEMNFESPLYCYFHFLQQLQTTTSTTTTSTATSKQKRPTTTSDT